MPTKVIYFNVSGRNEQVEFTSDELPENVKGVFRAAAEAHDSDILKLYNSRGSLINISPSMPENTQETRYRLEVVSVGSADSSVAPELCFNVEALQARLQTVESKLAAQSQEAPEMVQELKHKVETLRERLENLDHLSWLGLYKDMSSSPSLQPFWNKVGNESKTSERYQRVHEMVEMLGQHQFVTTELREYLKKLTLSNWKLDDAQMILLMQQMFIDLDLLSKCKIELPVLDAWIFTIYKSYNDVPFHNFKHCFMVTQMMYALIWLLDLHNKMDIFDILTLLVSAICHDLDHPGYNNAYQINARTELARRYNDISPLENHHCSVAFEILENKDVNIFQNLPSEVFRRVREGMIKCILATDMAKHHEILKSFRAIVPVFDWSVKVHRDLLMNILIKMADISNEMRPLDVADLWLECLLQEYFKQSDMEKLEGLPVAPFMDRDKVTKPSSQIGFIKFILLPLVQAVGELFPVMKDEVIAPVQQALDYYLKMQQELEMEKVNNNAAGKRADCATSQKPHEPEKSKAAKTTSLSSASVNVVDPECTDQNTSGVQVSAKVHL